MKPVRVASLVATVAVIVGFADLPYGYYMLLRLFLCGVSLFFLFGANLPLEEWHRWTLGGFAVLYNPVLPIRIGEKPIWEILNIATVVLFWVVDARLRPSGETSAVRVEDRRVLKALDPSRLVLVVEDDVDVRRPLVKFLEMHGFAVVTAETADEGLAALRKHRFEAAVVDLRLRHGSGRDVVLSSPPEVAVVIFSGVPSESAELERLRPRTRLCDKPYSLVRLVETLEEMLAEE